MRYVAVYQPANPARCGRGVREFLYVEAMPRDRVIEHALENAPDGYTLVDVRPARDDTRYLPVIR
jgi:hypothetical protein